MVYGLVEVTQQKLGSRTRIGSQPLHVCPPHRHRYSWSRSPQDPWLEEWLGPQRTLRKLAGNWVCASGFLLSLSDLPIHKTGMFPSRKVVWSLNESVDVHIAPNGKLSPLQTPIYTLKPTTDQIFHLQGSSSLFFALGSPSPLFCHLPQS